MTQALTGLSGLSGIVSSAVAAFVFAGQMWFDQAECSCMVATFW